MKFLESAGIQWVERKCRTEKIFNVSCKGAWNHTTSIIINFNNYKCKCRQATRF